MRAVKGGASGCKQGLDAIGGVNTFYADVFAAAQTELTTNGRPGVQKVIILLSDGDSNANASDVPAGKASNQCHQAITNAAAATAAGTWVYTAAYGASTSASPGSCWTDSPAISACSTLQQMASTPKKFFSDGQAGCTSPSNPSSELVGLFTNIGASLSSPRLLLNTTNYAQRNRFGCKGRTGMIIPNPEKNDLWIPIVMAGPRPGHPNVCPP